MAALVKVRNVGTTPFVDAWGDKQYIIPAGGEIVMEAEGPSLWLGYPGLRDDPVHADFKRRDQYQRLRTRYGWHGTPAGQTEEDWEELRPKLEVYTMDGERVWMILDDPEGEHARSPLEAPVVDGTEDVSFLREQMERQQRELDALRTLVESRQSSAEVPEQVGEDTPRKVPVGARRGSSER